MTNRISAAIPTQRHSLADTFSSDALAATCVGSGSEKVTIQTAPLPSAASPWAPPGRLTVTVTLTLSLDRAELGLQIGQPGFDTVRVAQD